MTENTRSELGGIADEVLDVAERLVEDISYDVTAGAVFELPTWAISFLSKKRKGGSGNASALQKAREARELAVVSTESSREAA